MDVQQYIETLRLLPSSRASAVGGGSGFADVLTGKAAILHPQSALLLTMVSLGFVYSVHNLIAPNMTAIASRFHFNNFERDEFIGGELTLIFYLPGIFVALICGVLSAFCSRRLLFTVAMITTAVSCFSTAFAANFTQLAWARMFTGVGIGGALPIVYSLVGDWFPPEKRTVGSAMVTASCGAGVFGGQLIATIVGAGDWRWPFVVISVPMLLLGAMLFLTTEDPQRGGAEQSIQSLRQHTGMDYFPQMSTRHIKTVFANRTNALVILQAFPGCVPWGVIIVYLHDYLVQDIGLTRQESLGAVGILGTGALVGVFIGGCVGEWLYAYDSRFLTAFCSLATVFRVVPFCFIFGWTGLDPAGSLASHTSFMVVLFLGGVVSTMPSPGIGAMLLNVNLPETRGTVFAFYSILDDLSKGFGTLFVSMIVPYVGGRAAAYRLALIIWVFCGFALAPTWFTLPLDEAAMRTHLNDAAMESVVRVSKRQAAQQVTQRCKAAGDAFAKERDNRKPVRWV
mmetsp:Transcript_23137/g.51028  ORF Transcript_23137/g.51028 Transcript_23137/m.51028 type:complete len:511 (-) Transcript_23137:86-1618(-)